MTLKPKIQTLQSKVPLAQLHPRTGPWGKIRPSSESSEVVRFCQGSAARGQKTHSYPYRVMTAWHWQDGMDREELRIEAGNDLITIHGKGLDRIVEALDTGTLELLSEIPGDMPSETGEIIRVTRIMIHSAS